MSKYLQYFWYVVRHKWYVFLACRREGLWWLGIVHDWSKFLPSEFFPYARHFYGKVEPNCYNCAHIVGSQCEPTYSGIGNGEQAPDCPDYMFSRGCDKTGYYKPTDTGDTAFDFAWLLHQKRNRHHWQWWILPEDEGGIKMLAMPHKYYKEMLCDWIGASRAQGHGGKIYDWYLINGGKMRLHHDTRQALSTAMTLQERLESAGVEL